MFNLKEYQSSLESLEEGQKLAQNESEAKRNLYDDWIQKCKKVLPPPPPKVVEIPEPENVSKNAEPVINVAQPNVENKPPTIK